MQFRNIVILTILIHEKSEEKEDTKHAQGKSEDKCRYYGTEQQICKYPAFGKMCDAYRKCSH